MLLLLFLFYTYLTAHTHRHTLAFVMNLFTHCFSDTNKSYICSHTYTHTLTLHYGSVSAPPVPLSIK